MKPRVPWNSSRWFSFPFNGYQYTKHYSSYFRKKKCAPPNFHAGDKCGVAPGQLEPLHGRQGWCWQLQLDTSQTHCRSSDLGGCPWLVLPVMHCFETLKNFSGPKKCFSSPHLCNLMPRQNKLSSPDMVEYLAYSSVWNACTWKNFLGPKKLFLSAASFAT